VRRFLCSQTIAMSLQGVPGIYFNSLLGAGNDLVGVEESGRARSINRRKWTASEIEALLGEDASNQSSMVFGEFLRRLRLRRTLDAFHPDASQTVLDLPKGLFGVRRDGEGETNVWMIANVTDGKVGCAMSRLDRHWKSAHWREIIGGWESAGADLPARLELDRHQVVWLVRDRAKAPTDRAVA
jgi:hypothetical protein